MLRPHGSLHRVLRVAQLPQLVFLRLLLLCVGTLQLRLYETLEHVVGGPARAEALMLPHLDDHLLARRSTQRV